MSLVAKESDRGRRAIMEAAIRGSASTAASAKSTYTPPVRDDDDGDGDGDTPTFLEKLSASARKGLGSVAERAGYRKGVTRTEPDKDPADPAEPGDADAAAKAAQALREKRAAADTVRRLAEEGYRR